MSIRSTPHPLNKKVNKKNKISMSHRYHTELLDKNVGEMYKLTASTGSDLMSGTFLDDRKLCSVEPSKFGEISGCSVSHQNIFNNPQPDFVEKISNDSFSSQLFKSHYGRSIKTHLKSDVKRFKIQEINYLIL